MQQAIDSSQERNDASFPTELLGVLRDFPVPLAVISRDGDNLLLNDALTLRYGAERLEPARLPATGLVAGGECEVRVLRPQFGTPVDARALAIPFMDKVLLLFRNRPEAGAQREVQQLRGLVGRLERLAATDHLTGAWNRAHFDRTILAEIERSAGLRQPLSLVLLDLDRFKAINDEHGHAVGDLVLQGLVALIGSNLRSSDDLFRWGGEEFVVLVRHAGYRKAERVAEKIRGLVQQHVFAGARSVTLSAGVAEWLEGERPESWFARLDRILYAAKLGGRNRVEVDRRGMTDLLAGARASPVLHLQWQEAYECGEAVIDGQHRRLFERANLLIDALLGDSADVLEALDQLLADVRQHFADEESILARHGYEDLESHQRAHAALLARAGGLRERVARGESSCGPLVEFLARDVVARHMLVADRAFSPLFAAGGGDD